MTIIGIDFGTTGSRIAYIKNGIPTLIENREGELNTLSYVFVEKDGSIVGRAALNRGVASDYKAIFAAKRLLGRDFGDPAISSLKDLSYFDIDGFSDEILLLTLGGSRTPDEVCCLIFKELLESARSALKEQVSQAVIAFPANFDVKQRSAIRQAAELAGWQVVRTLAEPTAAAFSNQSEATNNQVEIIGVFDFGGGTFDISIVAIDEFGIYEVIATDGDPFLGGEDLDFRLQTYVLERLGIDRKQLSSSSVYELKVSCERAKITLSSCLSARIEISDSIRAIRPNIPEYIEIDRDLFSDLIQDLVDRSIHICRTIFDELSYYGDKISVADVDRIVLVGALLGLPL